MKTHPTYYPREQSRRDYLMLRNGALIGAGIAVIGTVVMLFM